MNLYPHLLVIIPTRDRPQTVQPIINAFTETCTANTSLVFAIDEGIPDADAYAEAVKAHSRATLWVNTGEKSMVAALNGAAQVFTGGADAIAFMGDDHRPRTEGWDTCYLEALAELETGIVYGNDLLQGERLPTQVAMTADIPLALGHMAPPVLKHLFVDNFWLDLGRAANCIRYLPDVVVEHLHPYAGKAAMDPGYARVNDRAVYSHDALAYSEYASAHLAADVLKVKALR